MKRLLLFSLALIVTLASVVTSPLQRVAAADSLANFFPAETFAFADLDTDDLPVKVKALNDLLISILPDLPANWVEILTEQATQQAGRPISFEKDLIGWIGTRAAVGVLIPPETFKATLLGRSSGVELPKTLTAGLITVKDDILADAFLKLARFTLQPNQAAPINGEAVTLYTDASNMRVARWKGYLAFGDVEVVLDTVREQTATLDTEPSYQRMIGTLKPRTRVSLFVRAPVSGSSSYVLILGLLGPTIGNVFASIISGLQSTPTPTPSPTPQPSADEDTFADAVLSLGTSIHSVRPDGNRLILESSTWLNPDAVNRLGTVLKIPNLASILLANPKPISGTLIDKIPNSATAFLIGTDLKQIYESTLAFAAAVSAAQQLTSPQRKINGNMLEMFKLELDAGLRASLGIGLESDLLPWLDGDFVAYSTFNKDGVLNVLSTGQFPADSTLLVAVTDRDKAKSVLAALNETLSQQMNRQPAEPDAKGLYTLNLLPTEGITFGLIDDTLMITPSTGLEVATNALAGKNFPIDPIWASATQVLPKYYSQLWYLNTAHLQTFLNAIDTTKNPSLAAQIQQIHRLAAPFRSALIFYTVTPDSIGHTNYVLTLK